VSFVSFSSNHKHKSYPVEGKMSINHERVLGLDYGEKRIGVAVSDPLGITALALAFVPNDGKIWDVLAGLILKYQIKSFVVGLPRMLSGSDSTKTVEVRAFAALLESKVGLPVVFVDERLSTVAVTRHLIDAGVSRGKRKHVIDSQAAAFILQGYLDRLRSI
jgi:putative Holliday junction resolvase